MNHFLQQIIVNQDSQGIFVFKNSKTRKFQNQMYVLWALSGAVGVIREDKYLENIERAIEYAINKHMLDNGAFIWEHKVSVARKIMRAFNIRPVTRHYIFTCHQTSFVNALYEYYACGEGEDELRYLYTEKFRLDFL